MTCRAKPVRGLPLGMAIVALRRGDRAFGMRRVTTSIGKNSFGVTRATSCGNSETFSMARGANGMRVEPLSVACLPQRMGIETFPVRIISGDDRFFSFRMSCKPRRVSCFAFGMGAVACRRRRVTGRRKSLDMGPQAGCLQNTLRRLRTLPHALLYPMHRFRSLSRRTRYIPRRAPRSRSPSERPSHPHTLRRGRPCPTSRFRRWWRRSLQHARRWRRWRFWCAAPGHVNRRHKLALPGLPHGSPCRSKRFCRSP